MSSMDRLTTCVDMSSGGRIAVVNWGGDHAAVYYTHGTEGVRKPLRQTKARNSCGGETFLCF